MVNLLTQRLILRPIRKSDAPFIIALLNDPDFIRHIGDRGVRDTAGAEGYIQKVRDGYALHGTGLLVVELPTSGAPIGVCGLVRRDGLDHPDLGFAFLPEYRGQGYAREAARAVVDHARDTLKLPRLLAITALEIRDSIRLLESLGMRFSRIVHLKAMHEESRLFELDFTART